MVEGGPAAVLTKRLEKLHRLGKSLWGRQPTEHSFAEKEGWGGGQDLETIRVEKGKWAEKKKKSRQGKEYFLWIKKK